MQPILSARTIDPSEPPSPIDWVIPNFAARGYVTLLAGVAGVGKSSLMLQQAHAVARRVGVSALYLDIENGPDQLKRLHATMALTPSAVEMVDMSTLALSDAGTLAQLQRELIGRGIARMAVDATDYIAASIVVVDSLRRFAPNLGENSNDDMAPYLASLADLARVTRTPVVVIHHASDKSESSYRGASAILDQVDMAFALTEPRAGDAAGGLREDATGRETGAAAVPAPHRSAALRG